MRPIIALAVPPLFILATVAQAATLTETKLTASDGARGDRFGYSVALSGGTALVGARLDNHNGTRSGSAYVFEPATGTQIRKLTADDGAGVAYFGGSVALSGTTALVGAPADDDNGERSGSAYVFDTTTGTQIRKLTLTTEDGAAGDNFGASVALSGSNALVGATGVDGKETNSGAAYLFDTATGTQIAKLTADDGAEADIFGGSVALSGTTALIGARLDDDNGWGSGSAYLFDIATGNQIAKLTASDGAESDFFGYSVAISGTTALIGAFGDDAKGKNSGSAYLFDTVTGTQIRKLTASDGAADNFFGVSVALSGTTALIGAGGIVSTGAFGGAAYLFDITTGDQIAKLTATDAAADDLFGGSVALMGTTALVGARFDDDNGSTSGAAYLFADVPTDPVPRQVVPVSLPAGAWLLGTAALALIAAGHRRRRAAA